MALATLSIDLVAQTAKFEADMNRAAGVVQAAAARMDRAFVGVGSVFTGSLLAGAAEQAIRSLVQLYPQLIEGVAHFQDLEEQTGASAEALASFTTAGDVAGISADQLAGLMVKLTANLSTAGEESSKTSRALKFLGIDMAAFKELAPEKQFELLAQRLNALPNVAARSAVAVALLGRSGAQALPFLKELAQNGLSQNRLTAEQIRLADEYADRQARVRSELKQAAQIAALQTLPAFTALTEEVSKAAIAALGLEDASADLKNNTGLRDFAQNGVIAVATLGEALVGLVKLARGVAGSFEAVVADSRVGVAFAANLQLLNKGGVFNEENRAEFKKALEERNRIAAEANDRYVKLFTESGTKVSDALKFQFSEAGRVAASIQTDPRELARRGRSVAPAGRPGTPLPSFGDDGAAKAQREADQLRKALLDKALKDLEAAFASERDAVQFQQRYLEAQYQAGLVSIDTYYRRRAELGQQGLNLQLDQYAKEADALRESLRGTTDPSDRVKVEQKISEVEAKAASARQQFSQQNQLNALEEQRGYQQAAERIVEFRAQVLELQGDLAEAARLRANLAIDQARRSSVGTGLSSADISGFEQATRASLALADAQRGVQRVTEQAAIDEERFLIAARAAGASREQVEQGVTALRQAQLTQLGQLLRATEALAQGQGPDSPAVQAAQRLRLEYERAAANVDQLRLRLEAFADRTAGQIAGSITDAVIDGDWRAAGERIGRDLLRGILEEDFTAPLQDALRNILRGGVPGADGAGGVIGGAITRLFGGSVTSVPGIAGGQIPLGPGAVVGAAQQAGTAVATAAADAALLGLATTAIAADAALLLASEGLLELGITAIGADVGLIGLSAAAELAAVALLEVAGAQAGASALGFLGFDQGGWTGSAPVSAPVGVVHGNEYVFSAPAVRSIGVDVLDRVHRQARAGARRSGLPGFADGGFVRSGRSQTPAAPRGGPVTVHAYINPTVHGVPDRRTREHLAADISLEIQEAVERGTAGMRA